MKSILLALSFVSAAALLAVFMWARPFQNESAEEKYWWNQSIQTLTHSFGGNTTAIADGQSDHARRYEADRLNHLQTARLLEWIFGAAGFAALIMGLAWPKHPPTDGPLNLPRTTR